MISNATFFGQSGPRSLIPGTRFVARLCTDSDSLKKLFLVLGVYYYLSQIQVFGNKGGGSMGSVHTIESILVGKLKSRGARPLPTGSACVGITVF